MEGPSHPRPRPPHPCGGVKGVSVWEPPTVAAPSEGGSGLAFRFTPATVRTLLPRGFPGAYVLLRARREADVTPIYVGRSDTCLQTRLTRHPHRSRATHFVFAPTKTTKRAFWLEAAWYHQLTADHPGILNRLHPARPANSHLTCPFCPSAALDAAFRRSLTNISR